MAKNSMPPVEPAGVGAEQPFHPGDQVGSRGFEDEMKMVRQETPTVDLPAGLAAGFAQSIEEPLAIAVVAEDGFAPVAAVQDVVNRAGVLHAEFPGHAAGCPNAGRKSTPYSLMRD